ncbi:MULTISPECIES: alpha/beta hydrolase-fold protein [unclassified Pseudoalteromonas]|uniref:alpha/beta hydrolase-fold protein n=1 Tax=unclassified Pseudoalteromonas TaxID=194690 RepID=UPI0022B09A4D|nr:MULTISPECIES: alpha/beta hydrolase-fold protein [unclassified Pseudoalteromonas]
MLKRTSNHKTIFGHSMAGAFVIKALASKPDLFENYIATSPYMFPNDKALFTAFDKLFKIIKALINRST